MNILKPLRLYTHTHTHTVYCLLVNEDNILKIKYENRDRTILNFSNIGLSLSVFYRQISVFDFAMFLRQKSMLKEANKKYRANPNGDTI